MPAGERCRRAVWCVLRSRGGLAGESPVWVVAKQPSSWWPAERETGPSKRHDNVPIRGLASNRSAALREPCHLVISARASGASGSRALHTGAKANGRREELGSAAPKNPPGEWGWNGCTALHGTGEIRLDAGIRAAGRHPAAPGSSRSDNRREPGNGEAVERKSEEAVLAMNGVDNITRRSEGPLSRCARDPENDVGLPDRLDTHPRIAERSMTWGASSGRAPTPVARRNARGRLPGGKPDEGEPRASGIGSPRSLALRQRCGARQCRGVVARRLASCSEPSALSPSTKAGVSCGTLRLPPWTRHERAGLTGPGARNRVLKRASLECCLSGHESVVLRLLGWSVRA